MSDAAPLQELYQAVIDDHRRRPRHRGTIPNAQRVIRQDNPLCGDFCVLSVNCLPALGTAEFTISADTTISEIRFHGSGCALSQASASIATAAVLGRTKTEASALIHEVETLLHTGQSTHPGTDFGDIAALSAAHGYPARHPCALLAWSALRIALAP